MHIMLHLVNSRIRTPKFSGDMYWFYRYMLLYLPNKQNSKYDVNFTHWL